MRFMTARCGSMRAFRARGSSNGNAGGCSIIRFAQELPLQSANSRKKSIILLRCKMNASQEPTLPPATPATPTNLGIRPSNFCGPPFLRVGFFAPVIPARISIMAAATQMPVKAEALWDAIIELLIIQSAFHGGCNADTRQIGCFEACQAKCSV